LADNPFGFSKIYADKPNGEIYTLGSDPNSDPRLELSHEVINNGDGTFRFTDDEDTVISVLTSALFNEDNIVDDHGDLDPDVGGRGYMMDPKDWRDVEIDFEFKVYNWTSTNGFTVTVGGGRHTNPQPFCEGCGYIIRFYYNGDTQLLKEQWHNNKVNVTYEDSFDTDIDPTTDPFDYVADEGIVKNHIENLRDKWCLMKVTRHNAKNSDGVSGVHFQVFLNPSGDKKTWVRIYSIIDTSGWGRAGKECNGKTDQVLNWGFPMVRIEWRNATRVDWYGLHVREIQPTAPVPEDPGDNTGGGGGGGGGGDGGGGSGGGQPEIPPPEQPTGKVEKIGSFRFSIASAQATSCDGIEPANPPTDPPPGNGGGGNPPPPAGSTEISVYWSDYFKVGS
jgi:hypothetical protein